VGQRIDGVPCNADSFQTSVVMRASDPDDPVASLKLRMTYMVDENPQIAGSADMFYDDAFNQSFLAGLPVVDYQTVPEAGGRFTVTVRATDPAGNVSAPFTLIVTIARCVFT
jgi:hypothetical protein